MLKRVIIGAFPGCVLITLSVGMATHNTSDIGFPQLASLGFVSLTGSTLALIGGITGACCTTNNVQLIIKHKT